MTTSPLTAEERRALQIATKVLKSTRPDISTTLDGLAARLDERFEEVSEAGFESGLDSAALAEEAASAAASEAWWEERRGVSWGIPR